MINTDKLIQTAQRLGAFKASVIAVKDIPFEREFRKLCESNACGMFGKSWMCPPHVGTIDELIARAKSYAYAFVFQTVDSLEDSYDFEGMMHAGKRMNDITQAVRAALESQFGDGAIYLGAGGCRICSSCSRREEAPCRFPDKAMSSLEAYGISVSQLAEFCGMKYINGQDTVTYFAAVLFN